MKHIVATTTGAVCLAVLIFSSAALAAEVSGSVTLQSGHSVNLDSGSTTSLSSDVQFTLQSVGFLGTARGRVIPGVSGADAFNALTLADLENQLTLASQAQIPPSSLPVGAILGVQTNGGNGAKLLVTAINTASLGSGLISLQFVTFEGVPTISGVTNNYSFIPAGFPNSGVSPSSIVTVFGNNMSAPLTGPLTLQSSAPPGLPTTLNGATFSVTVGGTTVNPAMYYASPAAIATVLPANTPVGTGTIKVTYNNQDSNALTIQVVPAAPGLDTYYGTGSGLAVATDAKTGAIINYANPAALGQTIVLRGSGLGADPQDSDSVFTTAPHSVNQSSVQVYIGGVAANVLYAGSSGYPGLNQTNITIPASVGPGCRVSVVQVSENPSNYGEIPIGTGGQCEDDFYGVTGSMIDAFSNQTSVKYAELIIGQTTNPGASGTPQIDSSAGANFLEASGPSFGANGGVPSPGSCFVFQTVLEPAPSVPGSFLDAGSSIGLTGPDGSYTLTSFFGFGLYFATLPDGAIPSTGGAFTFNVTGGADVAAFSTKVTIPSTPFTWTDQSDAAMITLSQGFQVNWTPAADGSLVGIGGNSTGATGAAASFTCIENRSAGKFVVPALVTGSLPAGNGSVSVANILPANFTQVSVKGLDFAYGYSSNSIGVNATYH